MTEENKKFTVLVVDDIESIRFAIADYLKSDFNVFDAGNGEEALKIMEEQAVDLVITDIRMPIMGGLDLIMNISRAYPYVKYALMTAYNVNDYIHFVRKHHIWNIIPKTAFLDLHFIKVMTEKLLTGDIFGINKYYPDCTEELVTADRIHEMQKQTNEPFKEDVFYHFDFRTPLEYDKICDDMGEILMERGAPSVMLQVLEELTTNAMIRAPAIEKSQLEEKLIGKGPVDVTTLPEYDDRLHFRVSFGILKENAVIGITDNFGNLIRDEILFRLERHITLDKNGLPMGINDSHGRGLFISREHMDHLIFNIQQGIKTEVLGILSLRDNKKYRAISIYQGD